MGSIGNFLSSRVTNNIHDVMDLLYIELLLDINQVKIVFPEIFVIWKYD